MPQSGAAIRSCRVRQRAPQPGRDGLARVSTSSVSSAITPRMIVLPCELGEHLEVELGLRGLDRDLVDGRVGELGQEAVLALVAGHEQRVAEADVQRGRAAHAVERALQRLDAVLARLVGARLHPRLVELDDVDAGRVQVLDLGAHDVGERERDVALGRRSGRSGPAGPS